MDTCMFLLLLLFICLAVGEESCPTGCVCRVQDGVGTTFCMDTNLTAIPTLAPNTENLFMQGHQLGTLTNRVFTQTPGLKTLVLEACGIHTLQPGAFVGLKNLTSLNLKQNKIRKLEQGMFAGIPSINEIDLGSNDLHSIDEFTFDGLTKDLMIKMESNFNLKDISPKAFKGATIKELYFYNCSLSEESLESIFPLRNVLSVFFLSTNRIHLNIPSGLFKGFSLTNLNLADNGLTDVSFLRHVEADDISLEYNNIGTLNLSEFTNLHETRILRLSHTSSHKLDGSLFRGMSSLTQLYLSHNYIPTLPESLQTVFSGLERLTLDGNPIHCNCEVAWFQKWLTIYGSSVTPPMCETPNRGKLSDIPEEDLQCSAPSELVIKEKAESASDVTLKCSAKGDPPPVITWTTPEGTTHSTPPSLGIDIQESEGQVQVQGGGGSYTCTAHNLAGNVSREIVVTASYQEETHLTASTAALLTYQLVTAASCLLTILLR